MKKSLWAFILISFKGFSQFAPQAGTPGTTAIHRDSSVFVGWATGCTIVRGPQDISDPSQGYASTGAPSHATGKSGTSSIVSLGDGGSATLTFAAPIRNGEGPDFAVFENGFKSEENAYLELAFVEVSSDGVNFYRFPSVSLTDASEQVESFDLLDASKIHNLAGKYIVGYGTPFDLEDLKDEPGLDINNITHVRVIDVIGTINPDFATYDSEGNIVNDPWPTTFPAGGFDLEAVGVINAGEPTSISSTVKPEIISLFPNPARKGDEITLDFQLKTGNIEIELTDFYGNVHISQKTENNRISLPTDNMSSGVYFIKIVHQGKVYTRKFILTK
ncbi:MAG: T9SS type A sorting domain-containing protein [Cytophagaceae bacterium]